jgi:2-oxoisovalerate dehydrogenase E1 component
MKKQFIPYNTHPYSILSEPNDLQALPNEKILSIYFTMLLIHQFENGLIDLQKKGLLWGPLHTSHGAEAAAAAAIATLNNEDRINGTHRGHHQVISKGLNFFTSSNWNPLYQEIPSDLSNFITQIFAEILGLKNGLCGGRGGSMHLYYPKAGIHGTNGIVGGGIPTAAGLSLAAKHLGKDEVVVTFFGDGACNQGTFHETLNIASAWKLPIIFFVENNLYAVGTKVDEASSISDFALRGVSYEIPSIVVQGNDPIGTYLIMKDVVDTVRKEKKPFLIESKCYRPVHHDSPLPGSSYGYRTKEEEEEWEKKDAMRIFPQLLLSNNIATTHELNILEIKSKQIISESLAELLTKDSTCIKSNLWPKSETATYGIRSNGSEFENIVFSKPPSSPTPLLKFSKIISKITEKWMEKDATVIEWGEDVANFRKGPYGACEGLSKRFPNRIVNTPISESAFSGMALGAAMNGLKPIVEIMFPDFVLVAADQIFNQIGRARHMYGSMDIELPIVFRTRIATGTGMGPQHSMDPTALFAQFPGWRIIAPSTGSDYIGLFNTAMTSKDPVIILEHHHLYNKKFQTPENWDYFIPFGEASLLLEGTDITLITYGGMTEKTVEATKILKKKGISCDLLDLRSIDPDSIDYKMIEQSISKTGKVAIIEESVTSQSLGFRISCTIMENFWEAMQKPPLRISSLDAPVPTCKVIEEEIICSTQDIVNAILIWLVRE